MLFSRKLIESLVLNLACEGKLDALAVKNLLYHLTLPGEVVPFTIAETIAGNPEVGTEDTHFSPRLAYGFVEGGLFMFDSVRRDERRRRLSRQVTLIRLGLHHCQHSETVVDLFEKRLHELHVASLAAHDLASTERPLLAAELGTLTERIIECCMVQEEVTLLLLDRLLSRFERQQRLRMIERTRFAVDAGLENPPWDDLNDCHVVLAEEEPVCFRMSLLELPQFPPAAQRLVDALSGSART